jgi:hypothetical protein
MSAAVIVYAVIGFAVLLVGLAGPMYLRAGGGMSPPPIEDIGQVGLLTATLVVSMGLLHQLLATAISRGGHMLFILFVALANLLPPVTAATLRVAADRPSEEFLEVLTSLSPVALFSLNLTRVAGPPGGGGWLIGFYAALGALSYVLLGRILRRETSIVHTKLQTMGLSPGAA